MLVEEMVKLEKKWTFSSNRGSCQRERVVRHWFAYQISSGNKNPHLLTSHWGPL